MNKANSGLSDLSTSGRSSDGRILGRGLRKAQENLQREAVGSTCGKWLRWNVNKQFWDTLTLHTKTNYRTMKTAFNHRTFQLWEYKVSHGSLLIRSPKSPGVSTNIDLVCVGVEYLAAPRHIRGLELVEASLDEIGNLNRLLGKEIGTPDRVRIIVSEGRRFPIVAVSFRFAEHEEDIFYSPFDNETLK